MNYFEVFGIPKILNLDLRVLERTFHDLSRKYHPDYFTTASEADKAVALKMIALVNDAYRTLRNPIRRAEYLLDTEGYKPDGSKVPQSFLMEVFEINEKLDELRSGAEPGPVDSLRGEIQQKSADFTGRIEAAAKEWDGLVERGAADAEKKQQLSKMTEILSEFSYIRNLERELEEIH